MTFTGGDHAGWAVQITTGFSIANTLANILSGWASDFLWTKVRPSRPCPFRAFRQHSHWRALSMLTTCACMQFRFARHKLLALALLLESVVFAVLVGLSYGITHPSTAAQACFLFFFPLDLFLNTCAVLSLAVCVRALCCESCLCCVVCASCRLCSWCA